jgi:hypothetical protein
VKLKEKKLFSSRELNSRMSILKQKESSVVRDGMRCETLFVKITKTDHVWEMKCCGTGNTIKDTFPQSGNSSQGSHSTNTEYDIKQTSLYMTTIFFVPSFYVISYRRSMPYPPPTMCLMVQAGSSF